MRFDMVMLVGSGKILLDCARTLKNLISVKNMMVIETENSQLSVLKRFCSNENIKYEMEYKQVEQTILGCIYKKKVLIISAQNPFLFTPEIIDTPDIEIINYHYSLLPDYRGRYIPTWVIFNDEKSTGITWHYVTEKIDCGDIISQKKIKIDNTTTAFDITKWSAQLASDAFKEFIPELLEQEIAVQTIQYPVDAVIYKSRNLPQNGYMNIKQPLDEVDRLLRSYDYGALQIIPKLKIEYERNIYQIDKYQIKVNENHGWQDVSFENNKLTLCDGNRQIILYLEDNHG